VPGEEGKESVEFESWWAACLAKEVALLGLWKVVTNLLLVGLNLFQQLVVSRLYGALFRPS
jgi:hypothetical protein